MSTAYLRHRDASGRVFVGEPNDTATDRYIRPSDGRLVPLVVQGADDRNWEASPKSWTRIGKMRRQISPIIELVHWTYSSVFVDGSEERHYDDGAGMSLAMKWLPSCIVLVIMLLIPQDLEGKKRNNGFYDPIRYRDWGYSKVSRNAAENWDFKGDEIGELGESAPLLPGDIEMSLVNHEFNPAATLEKEMDEDFDGMPGRQFRPRWLCFLVEDLNGRVFCETRKVTDWIQEFGDNANTDFVLLSYTRKQFCVATEQELSKWTLPDERTRAVYISIAKHDRQRLLEYGIEAARSVGKAAFWLDFECIRDADNLSKATSQSDDVYRICDIVRAAHSVVILVGPPIVSRISSKGAPAYNSENMKEWLQEWGTRLWTLPEILLCSAEHRVKVFAIGGPSTPEQLAKRNFAARAWKDAKLVRQLVDHYESSIHLTPLELVSIALECFANRQTDQFNSGDIAYALMGLLRRRPPVDKSDSSFEAFARLSLVNDSDSLLERLLCMMPVHRDAPWHEIKDAWGARLWDIEPRCQIAGIVDDQTVTLDGAFGATIQWDSMEQVAFFKRPTLARVFGKILLRGNPAYLITALALTISGGLILQSSKDSQSGQFSKQGGNRTNTMALTILIPGILFLLPSALVMLCAPAMLLNIYAGKFWSTQALFIGVEGMVDIGEAERHLFGFNHGRLKWSTNGSTLSRHRYVNGECVALPPAAKSLKNEDERETLFTLIDTYSLTATCFYAQRPPVAVIVCGQEGGMQRALLCSYDWTRQTFAKETVLRVKTLVLDRMLRVDRFRFALKRNANDETDQLHTDGDGNLPALTSASKTYGASRFWPTLRVDLVLLPILWLLYAYILSPPAGRAVGKLQVAWYGGLVVALIPCAVLLRRLQTGLAVAVPVVIFAALNIGLIYMPADAGSTARDIAFYFVFGVMAGFILPAFIFLTGAWYTAKEQAVRILIWAFSSILVNDVLYEILWTTQSNITNVVFYAIYILLAAACIFLLKPPSQASWMPASDMSFFSRRHSDWSTAPWSTKEIPAVLKEPKLWLFFAASLFNNAFATAVHVMPKFNVQHMIWALDIPATIIALLIGVTFMRLPSLRVPVMALSMTLQLAAGISFVYNDINDSPQGLNEGLWFLFVTGSVVPFLIWALALSNSHDLTSRITTIITTIGGYSIGGLIGGAYFTALPQAREAELRMMSEGGPRGILDFVGSDQVPGYLAFVSVFYSLAMVTFALWFLKDRQDGGKTAQRGEMSESGYERPLMAYSEPSQMHTFPSHKSRN